jgi:hypothetical protein
MIWEIFYMVLVKDGNIYHHIGGLEMQHVNRIVYNTIYHHIGGLEIRCGKIEFLSHLCGGKLMYKFLLNACYFLSHLCGGA